MWTSSGWGRSFYGYDGQGSVRFLTAANGLVTDYDAFGDVLSRSGNTPNHYLFCGEQFDSDLKLYYLRARSYNPDSGRFWTQDSFEGFGSEPAALLKSPSIRMIRLIAGFVAGEISAVVGGLAIQQKAMTGTIDIERSVTRSLQMPLTRKHSDLPSTSFLNLPKRAGYRQD